MKDVIYLRSIAVLAFVVLSYPSTAQITSSSTNGACSPIIANLSGNFTCNIGERKDINQFLNDLRSKITEGAISNIFGPAIEKAVLPNELELTIWESDELFFVTVDEQSKGRVAIGVISKLNVAEIIIPLLTVAVDDERATLKSFTLEHFWDCQNMIPDNVDGRFQYWTVGQCYFGRAGAYSYWEFSVMGFGNCDTSGFPKSWAKIVISELPIDQCHRSLTPFSAIVRLTDDPPEDLLSDHIFDIIFWEF